MFLVRVRSSSLARASGEGLTDTGSFKKTNVNELRGERRQGQESSEETPKLEVDCGGGQRVKIEV